MRIEIDPLHLQGVKLLAWVEELSKIHIPKGSGFKPVSSWRAGFYREKPGVLAKAVNLVGKVRITRVSDGVVEAVVPSEGEPGRYYRVKIYTDPLDFECECPHGKHRFNPCKHVIAVVLAVIASLSPLGSELYETPRGVAIASAVHMALCVHAYLKARQLASWA